MCYDILTQFLTQLFYLKLQVIFNSKFTIQAYSLYLLQMQIQKIVQIFTVIKAQADLHASIEERTAIKINHYQFSNHLNVHFLSEGTHLAQRQQKQNFEYCLLRYKQNYFFKCLFTSYQELHILISAIGDDVRVIQNNSIEMDKCTYGLLTVVDGTKLLQYAYSRKLSQYFQSFLEIQKMYLNMGSFQKSKIAVFWQRKEHFSPNLKRKQWTFTILGAKNNQQVAKLMKIKIQQQLQYTFNILKLGFNAFGDLSITIFQQRVINNDTSIKTDRLIRQMNKSFKEYNQRRNKFSIEDQQYEQTRNLYDVLY